MGAKPEPSFARERWAVSWDSKPEGAAMRSGENVRHDTHLFDALQDLVNSRRLAHVTASAPLPRGGGAFKAPLRIRKPWS